MTRHIILAYGRETEHWRATFAILSFWAWYGADKVAKAAVQTVIFTDRPEFFAAPLAGLPVDYKLLTPAQQTQMRGPQQYVHREKIGIIDQAFRDYPGDDLLFCDSDTFFFSPASPLLARLRPGVSLLHLREFTLAEAVDVYAGFQPAGQERYPLQLLELLKSRSFSVAGRERRFAPTEYIWNSGVLGLTADDARLMPDVFTLNDAFYAGSGWIITEQIAFSLALHPTTELAPSDEYVFHYWGKQQKVLMDRLLDEIKPPRFSQLALAERLAAARRLTGKWRRAVELHKVQEGALYALSNGQLVAGLKYTVKALLAAPFDTAFARNIVLALRKKTGSISH